MFFESFALNLCVAFVLIIALTFDYVTKFFSYWYVRHVVYKTPIPFFGSDYHRILAARSNTQEINTLYQQYPKEDLVGSIKSRIPDLIVKDPDLIKKVLSTSFENFQNRGIDLCKSQDVCLRENLFYADDEKWTLFRESYESLLNNLSTPNDGMFDCLSGISGDTNVQVLLSNVLDSVLEQLLLGDHKNNVVNELRSRLQQRSIADKFKSYLKNIFPSVYVFLGLVTLPGQPSAEMNDKIKQSKLLMKIEAAFNPKNEKSKFIQNDSDSLAFGVLVTFITEGYIPCLNSLTTLFYELAKRDGIQKKARISDEFLDATIKESLRLYPAHSVITRKCVKTYKFPDLNDNKVLIDKGVTINIPVDSLHKDDAYFKEAKSFMPERFLGDMSQHDYAYLPFGAGPRKCVGEQLSLQILRNVSKGVLRKFEISTTSRTPTKLSMVDHNFGRVISKDVWLKFSPI